jgi:hypothetical protein
MRSLLPAILCTAAAIAVSSPAFAASEKRVVPANRPSAIMFYWSATEDSCYSGAKPTVHFTGEPEHGSVATAWKAFVVPKGRRCGGMPAHGTLVIYRPKPGYHGPDKVSVVFQDDAPSGYFSRPREWTVNITVK